MCSGIIFDRNDRNDTFGNKCEICSDLLKCYLPELFVEMHVARDGQGFQEQRSSISEQYWPGGHLTVAHVPID